MNDGDRVQLDIDTAKHMISLKESLALLRKNKYFKEIIEEGYFKEEMNRLVMLKGAPAVTEEIERSTDKLLTGIAGLNMYFLNIDRRGTQMEAELPSYEAAREDILAEEIEDGGDE